LKRSRPFLQPSRLHLVVAILIGGASSAVAGSWEPLFNGKDLTGWRQVAGSAPYTVRDGAIVGTTVAGSPNSFLATEKTYGDFIFEGEILQEVGPSNSGIQFRSTTRPAGGVHGYQVEIDPSPRAWTGGIYDEARRGWLYPVDLNPRAHAAYQFGRWNLIRIEAIGPSIRTWVNGIPVAHVIDDLVPQGFFALQVHSVGEPSEAGRRILFRNLKIQTTDLHASPLDDLYIRNTISNVVSEPERSQGWRLLWDGRTTKGWRGALQKAFPDVGWRIENGELVVPESEGTDARRGGDIVTEEEFAAFEFQAEFKLAEGANSGIKYFVTEAMGAALGLEFQLLDDAKHPDAKLGAAGNRLLGSLYDLIPRGTALRGLAVVPRIGEWQHARVVVFPDNRVQHWLNGIKVVEYQRGSPLFKALVARSKYEKMEAFGLAEKGRLLLQDHGNHVRFRSIKVRSLPRS
jgi:hypothetical protein